MHAFILAGGFATRLWPLTESRPKPLLPLAGKPILTHLVEKIPEGTEITVSTNAVFAEAFHDWREELPGRDVHILIEDTKADDHKLGALGATAQWIEDMRIDDDVLLLTGDNYIGFSLKTFIDSAQRDIPLLAAHDIGDLENAKAFGTVILTPLPPLPPGQRVGGRGGQGVRAFEEKPKSPRSTLVSTGVSLLPRTTLSILTEYARAHPDNVGGIFEEFLRRSLPVHAFVFTEPWFDIGSFDAYLSATRALVKDDVIQGSGSCIAETQCSGSIVLGDRSSVRSSHLKDVILFQNCSVEDCDLENCILDDDCVLKGVDLRGKMLRKGTRLEREN